MHLIKILKLQNFIQKKNKLKINYLCSSPEKLKIKKKFDVILNMEIVEHVEDVDLSLIHISSPRDLSTSRMPSSA